MTEEKIGCPSCEHENAPEARFCEKCGESLTAPGEEAEAKELVCASCGEANIPEAQFCKVCGEPLAVSDAKVAEDAVEPEKKARKRLPAWARVVLMSLLVAVIAAALGLGFAYISPFLDTYMTHSPARMERAGLLAQELVDRVYPAFTEAERMVLVDSDGDAAVYVVDFFAHDGVQSLALRILVDKYITAARALEYLEIDAPEPYDDVLTIDAGDGAQVQPVPSEGLEAMLVNPQIVFFDDFSSLDESRWAVTDGVEINAEGQVELSGESPFATNLFGLSDFTGGEAFIFSLRYSTGTDFEIALDSGEWQTDSFIRAGVYRIGGEMSSNIWRGSERIDEQTLSSLPIGAGRWYGVLGAADHEGTLAIMFWDLENPSLAIAFQKEFGEEAAGLSWMMHIAADRGTVTVDDYYQIEFEGFR